MTLKITAVAIGVLLLGVGIGGFLSAPQENPNDRSIASLARRAKNQGNKKVTVPGKILDYPGMNIGLDEALQKYSVVIAEPIESTSFITDSLDNISTAYKFRIVETISQRSPVFCNSCPSLNDVSDKLQPARYDEFLLELAGGTVTVDGVEITMVSGQIPKFEDRKRYLMFINFTPAGMASTVGGPSGIFRITSDESLEAVGNVKNRMPAEIATRFSQSLSRFKQATKR